MQTEVQQDVLILVCVRCDPDQLTDEEVERLRSVLGSADMRQEVQKALVQRRRRPYFVEVPIVGGVDLGHVDELLPLLIQQLHEMVGIEEVREQLKRYRA